MGKRGPQPIPTKLKLLRGNPGHQKLPKGEPKPQPIAPTCPSWLPAEAKRAWKYLAPKLETLGLFTEIDLLDFQCLCVAVADFKAAVRVIKKLGHVATYGVELNEDGEIVKTGYQQQRPEVGIMHRSMEMVSRFGAKFGLSPADRVGLGVKGRGKEDDFDEFLKKKGGKQA